MRICFLVATLWTGGAALLAQTPAQWKFHDMQRPRPRIVTPGEASRPGSAPSDAILLFDGHDLSQWHDGQGGPPGWRVKDGHMEATPGSGSVMTRRGFGDVQLHLEWASPHPPEGHGQNRGNSGVYLMGLYEVQILDSHENSTYADGQAAAIYGQHPPLVNASRPAGQWQSYDIFFRRPRFDINGQVRQPARVTVVHNGVLVQDSVEFSGPAGWLQPAPYRLHPDQLPLMLQGHHSPVRFRNIWIRPLKETSEPGPPASLEEPSPLRLAQEILDRYAGRYQLDDGGIITVAAGNGLRAAVYGDRELELIAISLTEFQLRWTAARLVFDLDSAGRPTQVSFHIGGEERLAVRLP